MSGHSQTIFRVLSGRNWVKHHPNSLQCVINNYVYLSWRVALSHSSCVLFLLPTSHVAATCLIFPRYNNPVGLGVVPTVPKGNEEFRHLSWVTSQSRDSILDCLPDAQNSVTNYYRVHAWHTLDLPLGCRGAQSASSVNPQCVRFAAYTELAHMASLAWLAYPSHFTWTKLCVREHVAGR